MARSSKRIVTIVFHMLKKLIHIKQKHGRCTKRTKIEPLQIKTAMSEKTWDEINSRLEIAEEQISKFVNVSLKHTLARETLQK